MAQPVTLDIWIKTHAEQAVNDLRKVGEAQQALIPGPIGGAPGVAPSAFNYPIYRPGRGFEYPTSGFGSGTGMGEGISPEERQLQHNITATVAGMGTGRGGGTYARGGGRLAGLSRLIGMGAGTAEALSGNGGVLGGIEQGAGGLASLVSMIPGPVGAVGGVALAATGAIAGAMNSMAKNAYEVVTQYWTSGITQRLGMNFDSFYDWALKRVGRGVGGMPIAVGYMNPFLQGFTSSGGSFTGGTWNRTSLRHAMAFGQLIGADPTLLATMAGQGQMLGLNATDAFGQGMRGLLGGVAGTWGAQNFNLALSTLTGINQMIMRNGATPFAAANMGGTSSSQETTIRNLMLNLANPGVVGPDLALTPLGAATTMTQALGAASGFGALNNPASVIALQSIMRNPKLYGQKGPMSVPEAQGLLQAHPEMGLQAIYRFINANAPGTENLALRQEMFAQALGMQGNMRGASALYADLQAGGGKLSPQAQVDWKRLQEEAKTPLGGIAQAQSKLLAGLNKDMMDLSASITKTAENLMDFGNDLKVVGGWLGRGHAMVPVSDWNANNPNPPSQTNNISPKMLRILEGTH